MLKTQVINNTWVCDSCALETQGASNPYYNICILSPKTDEMPSILQIDLCQSCSNLVQVPPITDFVSNK